MPVTTYHLEIDNPDNSAEMPLYDGFAASWWIFAENVAKYLEPGQYPARFSNVTNGHTTTDYGLIVINSDNSVIWCQR